MKQPFKFKRVTGWSEVYLCLKTESTRASVLAHLRSRQISLESVGTLRASKVVLLEALILAEDKLETMNVKATIERFAIRGIRRRLEWECFQ